MSVATQSLFISKEMKALASPTTVAMEKSVSALVERGQADEDPAFVCLASQRRNGGLGPLLNLPGRSSLVVQSVRV